MMTLEKHGDGFLCTMRGTVTDADIDGYLREADRLLGHGDSFYLLVDSRESKILASDSQQDKMVSVMDFFVSRGLSRVAVVATSAMVAMQMNRLASGSPAGKIQLAVNGSDPDWESVALDWVKEGKSPAAS